MVQDGTLSLGELVGFILYLNAFFQPIQSLVQQYNLYQQGQAVIDNLNDLRPAPVSRRPSTPRSCPLSTATSCSTT